MDLQTTIANLIDSELEQLKNYTAFSSENDGLMDGNLGICYFLSNIYLASKEEWLIEKIENTLSAIFERISYGNSSLLNNYSFYEGVCGLGYILNFLCRNRMLDEEVLKEMQMFDDYLAQSAIYLLNNDNYDFLNGPFGILFYFIVNDKSEFAIPILKTLNKKFFEEKNFFLFNNFSYIEGMHIGFAHGITGIAKILDYSKDKLSVNITNYILETLFSISNKKGKLINNAHYHLPRSIHRDVGENWQPVLSWSNSDLNFSTLITTLENTPVIEQYSELSDLIATSSINRRIESQTRVWDHRFFFGSSGIAQQYLVLLKKKYNDSFMEAYNFWINESVKLYQLDNIDENKYSLINNKLGTLLVLYEYIDKRVSGWDKIFLL